MISIKRITELKKTDKVFINNDTVQIASIKRLIKDKICIVKYKGKDGIFVEDRYSDDLTLARFSENKSWHFNQNKKVLKEMHMSDERKEILSALKSTLAVTKWLNGTINSDKVTDSINVLISKTQAGLLVTKYIKKIEIIQSAMNEAQNILSRLIAKHGGLK